MPDNQPVEAFSFAFQPPLDTWARWFAIVPTRSFVRVDAHGFEAVYGSWRVASTWSNVRSVERTGPYRSWKIAGPVRVSLADRGLTMAATTVGGVCLQLHEPVSGLDPLGLFRHRALTLGVEDLDRFVVLAEAYRELWRDRDDSTVAPDHRRGSVRGALAAMLNWRRRSVDAIDRRVDHVVFPIHDRGNDTDDQPHEIGVGAAFHRTYRSHIDGPDCSAETAMARVRVDPNALAEATFAPFTKVRGRSGEMVVGDRYVIQLAGPWKGAVEVIDVEPRSFRFATLEGHMESGVIEMRAHDVEDTGRVEFTIESWARSHDRVFDVIYDKVGIAQLLQAEMWAIACDRFAHIAGGTTHGALHVMTERQRSGRWAIGRPEPTPSTAVDDTNRRGIDRRDAG